MFEKEWMQLIEEPRWIAFDKPFEGITGYLKKMKKDHTLFLVTARQFENVLTDQLNHYDWTGLFQKVFITKQHQEKFDLLKNSGIVANNDWLIGDTGKDIETGKQLGIHTAAVTSGFHSEEILKAYAPDVITESVLNLSFDTLKS
jgi:phosphoglycolate phosphatase